MEGSEVQDDGETSQDPGLAEAPTGVPPASDDEETVPETDDRAGGAPETEGEDIDPEAGGATDTEDIPDTSGGSI